MVDILKVSALLQEVADTKILPKFGSLNSNEKWQKKVGGLVTVADIESEKFLSQVLTDLLPGSSVLGEEGAAGEKQPYLCLDEDSPVWIIDPLDGTNNFSKGKNDFVIIVALSVAKKIRAGWIYAPIYQQIGVAEEGGGAWLGKEQLNLSGSLLSVDQMRGSLGRRFRNFPGIKKKFAALSNASCCGMEYLNIASGKLDFVHFRRLKPWDHAAGDLIIREAGGIASYLDGTRYQVGDTPNKGLLIARDQKCWNSVADAIEPVFATL